MENTDINIAKDYPGEARLLLVILLVTLALLSVGMVAPIITLNKFILIENTFSIFSGSIELLKEKKFFLFFVITSFSIVLPFLKIAVLFLLVTVKQNKTINLHKCLHWMHLFGIWSMLDVFVVAVLVVTVKLGAIASVEARYGIYAFTAAVFLTMYVTSRVVSLTSVKKGK
ncbi:MAG: paraquat-inducible protein A [Gammaproteobacteria bacterium]|nr:paraquat-inducible protein A [Gammaproteobacteria bacterium]